MTQVKRINRKSLLKGVVATINRQRSDARNEARTKINEDLETSETILVLRALAELHPSMKKIFEDDIEEFKQVEAQKIVGNMPYPWLGQDEQARLLGKLELLTDAHLQSLTLEELTSEIRE